MLDGDGYLQKISKISESDLYKALMKEYFSSLEAMESSMNEDQFQMVLNHERVLRKVKTYIDNKISENDSTMSE